MNMISSNDHHELILVYITYYSWFDIDVNVICTILRVERDISNIIIDVVIHNTRGS